MLRSIQCRTAARNRGVAAGGAEDISARVCTNQRGPQCRLVVSGTRPTHPSVLRTPGALDTRASTLVFSRARFARQEEAMMVLRYASLGVVLLLFVGCTSVYQKPIEVDMPTAQKHFI